MPARAEPITPLFAKNIAQPGKYPDGARPDGLFLHVLPTGTKVWRLRYWHQGREKQLSLGEFPAVGIRDARLKRDEHKLTLRDGIDPSAQRKALAASQELEQRAAIDARAERRSESKKAATAAENTFGVLAKAWYERTRGKWRSGKHAGQVWDSLETELKELWKRPAADIEPRDVLAIIEKIEARPAPEVAKRTLQRCAAVFAYAMIAGKAKHNPAAGLSRVLKAMPERHFARLPWSDVPDYLKAVNAYRGWQTRAGLKLLMLTFVRSGELRGAKWDEFDLEGAVWRIPAARMKGNREHLVPLSKQAVAILAELKALNGSTGFVLPMEQHLDRPASENVFLQAIKKMKYTGRMTGHGARGIASTRLREMGFPPEVVERQLAHAEQSKTIRAYNSAEYLRERTQMMQAWADELDRVVA